MEFQATSDKIIKPRKRVSNACVSCREKHSKCGFVKPCTRCVSLGLECVTLPAKKRGVKKLNECKENLKNKESPSKIWTMKITHNKDSKFLKAEEDFFDEVHFSKFPFEEPQLLPLKWFQYCGPELNESENE
eukprot:gene6684-10849_t